MIGLAHALDISQWALFTNQLAINVTGHNIANVNTKGYSRQTLQLEANIPMDYFPGQLGGGVKAKAITRSYDRFLGVQITNELQPLGYWQAKKDMLSQVESVFNESSDHSLHSAISHFWGAWQQLSNDPTNAASRSALIANAQELSTEMNHTYEALFQLQKDTNGQIKYAVSEINRISDEIADLNKQIAQAKSGGENPNDLMDRRDVKLKELAGWIDVNYFQNDAGELNIFTGGGRTLVQSVFPTHLHVTEDPTHHAFYRITWEGVNGGATDITDAIRSGKLKGYLDLRDHTIPDKIQELDKVAAGIINEVNKRHYRGFGLDGTTNINFFNPLAASFGHPYTNHGDADITGAIYDPTILSRDDYRIEFATATTYKITNARTGQVTGFQIRAGHNDQIVFDDGGGNTTITLTPGAYTGDQLAREIKSQLEAHSSAGQTYTVTWDREDQHFLIKNDAGNAHPLTLNWAGSSAAATLGFTANDTLTPGQTVTSDTAVDHTFQYTSGADVYFEGIRYRITDGAGGGPVARDQFTISSSDGASKTMEVNPDIVSDPNKIAAAESAQNLPGDNQNALALADLQHQKVMQGDTATIDEIYNGLVGDVGIQSRAAESRVSHYQAMKDQLDQRRESISGVSLDEEMVNLIKYQQAFTANGKMISAINDMMKELMDLI